MNKKFTKLIAALALLVFMTPSLAGWGQTRDLGDELAKCTSLGGTNTSYQFNQTLTDSHDIDWVVSVGSNNFLGANNATNHGKVKPRAQDLPVVKAVNANATTNTTGYYYFYTTEAVSNVGSLEFVYTGNSGNTNNVTAYVVVGDAVAAAQGDNYTQITLSSASTAEQGESVGSTGTYTFTFNETQTSARYYGFIIVTSSYKRMGGVSIKLLEGSTGGTTVATPTFSLNSGITGTTTYSGDKVLLDCQTEGATIYYTMGDNPADPNNTSAEYISAGITLSGNTTIKAVAYDGTNYSSVASKTYTVLTPLTTTDQIMSAATTAGSTAADAAITFDDWIVSGVGTNAKRAFVTDGTKGFIIYNSNGGLTFAQGNVLNGTKICQVQLLNGAPCVTGLNKSDFTIPPTGQQPNVTTTTIDALSAVNTGAVVDLGILTWKGSYFEDNNSTPNRILYYNTIYSQSFTTNKIYNVKGVYVHYAGGSNDINKEIAPRDANDITEVTTYTVTYDGNGADGGTTPTDNTQYTSGQTVTVLANTFTKTGHTFDYWTKDAEGNDGPYVAGDEFAITANTTFYAQWGANLHDYSLTITGADNQAEAQLYVDNSAVAQGAKIAYGKEVTVVVAVNSGYAYTIEVEDADNTPVAVTNDKFTMPDSDVEVTVTTTQVSQHTITFNPGTGSCNTASATEYEGTSITLPTANPPATCTGWTFAGWATSSVSETTTAPTLLNGNYTMGNIDATLYAVYSLTEGSAFDNTAGGDFKIYAIVPGNNNTTTNYYATGTGSKISTVTDPDDATVYTFEKPEGQNYGNGEYAIKCTVSNTTYYITYGSSTSFSTSTDTPYKWTISSSGDHGSWRLTASSTANDNTVRGFVFQNYSTNNNTTTYTHQFGAYAVSNVDGDDYFDVEIGGGSATTYNTNPACTLPTATIIVTETEVEVSAEAQEGTIEVTYENFGASIARDVVFYTKNGEIYTALATTDVSTVYPWITASINSANNVVYMVGDNTATTSRQAYLRVYAYDGVNEAYSDYITIAQAAAPQQRTLTIGTLSNINEYFIFDSDDPSASPLIITNNAVSIEEGKTVYVSLEVANGYVLESLNVAYGDSQSATITEITANSYYSFTMPAANATLTATTIVNPYLTATLSSSDMAGMENAGTGYGILKYTTVNNFYWETTGYQTSSNNVVYGMIQLKKRDGNNYIRLPEFPGKIESITLAVTAASANTSSGTACTATLAFQAGSTSSENVIVSNGNSSGTNEITLDLSNKFYSTGYITITSSTGARIWNIDVTYRPYQDMTGNTLETIGNDVTVSIPANTNVTATNLTIPVNSGIIIKSGAKLTVSGTLTNSGTANNIVIEDGGQLIHNNDGVQATVQKNIAAHGATPADGGWYFISSPIMSSSSYDLGITPNAAGLITDGLGAEATPATATYDLYKFDQGKDLEWRNYRNASFSFSGSEGYLYANVNDVTLSFEGEIRRSDQNVTTGLDCTSGASLAGWNLRGNPFTCKAYSSLPYYVIDGARLNTTAVLASTPIDVCTGIMVHVDTDGSMRFSRTQLVNAPNGNLQMTLAQQVVSRDGTSTGSTTIDNAIVSFNGSDLLEKFVFNADLSKLYIPQNGKDYAIVSTEAQGEMPVNFRAAENGTYTLSMDVENVEMNYLHLIDNMTGNDIDLLQTPSYTFNATTTDYESRFKLVFCTGVNDNSDSFAFCSNGNWIISNEGQATLQVIDVTGRILSSETVNGSVSKTINATPGVYMIRLINGENVMVQKIVVR